jgi:hypothetical protein
VAAGAESDDSVDSESSEGEDDLAEPTPEPVAAEAVLSAAFADGGWRVAGLLARPMGQNISMIILSNVYIYHMENDGFEARTRPQSSVGRHRRAAITAARAEAPALRAALRSEARARV